MSRFVHSVLSAVSENWDRTRCRPVFVTQAQTLLSEMEIDNLELWIEILTRAEAIHGETEDRPFAAAELLEASRFLK